MQEPVDPAHLDDLGAWMERNAEGRDEANRQARAELIEARAAIARVEAAIEGLDEAHGSVMASVVRAALEPRP